VKSRFYFIVWSGDIAVEKVAIEEINGTKVLQVETWDLLPVKM
jgi:hypothetical protein